MEADTLLENQTQEKKRVFTYTRIRNNLKSEKLAKHEYGFFK